MKIYNYTICSAQNICRKAEVDIYNDNMSLFELRNPERTAEIAQEKCIDIEYNGNDDVIPDSEKIVKNIPLYMLIKSNNNLISVDVILTIDKNTEITEDINTYAELTELQLLNQTFFEKYPFKWIKRKY